MATAATTRKDLSVIETHPCFNAGAHRTHGRIHLPVAPRCTIACRYCVRKYDCVNESRPGVASKVLTAAEGLDRVRSILERDGRLSVVGVAGPGDPLANPGTLELLRMVDAEFPAVTLCLSTNGLALADHLDEIAALHRCTLTVTVNALTPATAARIYRSARWGGRTYRDEEAGALMIERQWEGIRGADERGIVIKVNSVFVPGVNEHEIPRIAVRAAEHGVNVMNITPLIPQGEYEGHRVPTPAELHAMRARCREHLPLVDHCRQCRSDACGLLGEDRDLETETLLARVGEEYEEAL